MTQTFFKKGANSTLQLPSGVNFSYQSSGLAIYDSTEVDTWYVGDFVSADYIINAEYGVNERETIHATLVATPGSSNITIYGRTTLSRHLINIRSISNNSKVSLVIQPASQDVSGSIISYFANYAKSTLPIQPLNAPAIATGCHWSSVTNTTVLTITATNILGTILVGQRVTGDNIPSKSFVKSYDSQNKQIIITGFDTTNINSASDIIVTFETSPLQLVDKITTIQPEKSFKSLLVQGQTAINATTSNDYVSIVPGDGIQLTTNPSKKEITISSTESFKYFKGGNTIIRSTPGENTLSIIGTNGVSVEANNSDKSINISIGNVIEKDITIQTAIINNLQVNNLKNTELDIYGNLNVTGQSILNSTTINGDLNVSGTNIAVLGSFTNLVTSGTVSGNGFLNYLASPPAIGITTANSGKFSSITNTGNLIFSGIGNRITGDFTNSTQSNRVMFQSNVSDGNTELQVIPNGSATLSGFGAFNSSDPTNSASFSINATVSGVNFISDKTGSGTYIPLNLYTGGKLAVQLDTSQNVGIGLTPIANNGVLQLGSYASVKSLIENVAISYTSPSSTITFDVIEQSVKYYTVNTSTNFTINFRGDSSTMLNTIMQNGQSITIALLITNGIAGYYPNVFQIDGKAITPKYANGSPIISGNSNAIDIYSISIIKTANSTYTMFLSQSKYS